MNTDYFEGGLLVLDRYSTSFQRYRLLRWPGLDSETDLRGWFSWTYLLHRQLFWKNPPEIKNDDLPAPDYETTKSYPVRETTTQLKEKSVSIRVPLRWEPQSSGAAW